MVCVKIERTLTQKYQKNNKRLPSDIILGSQNLTLCKYPAFRKANMTCGGNTWVKGARINNDIKVDGWMQKSEN
jgi:hypothetical protein